MAFSQIVRKLIDLTARDTIQWKDRIDLAVRAKEVQCKSSKFVIARRTDSTSVLTMQKDEQVKLLYTYGPDVETLMDEVVLQEERNHQSLLEEIEIDLDNI